MKLVDEPFDGKPPMLLEGYVFDGAVDARGLDEKTEDACNVDTLAGCGGRAARSG